MTPSGHVDKLGTPLVTGSSLEKQAQESKCIPPGGQARCAGSPSPCRTGGPAEVALSLRLCPTTGQSEDSVQWGPHLVCPVTVATAALPGGAGRSCLPSEDTVWQGPAVGPAGTQDEEETRPSPAGAGLTLWERSREPLGARVWSGRRCPTPRPVACQDRGGQMSPATETP